MPNQLRRIRQNGVSFQTYKEIPAGKTLDIVINKGLPDEEKLLDTYKTSPGKMLKINIGIDGKEEYSP